MIRWVIHVCSYNWWWRWSLQNRFRHTVHFIYIVMALKSISNGYKGNRCCTRNINGYFAFLIRIPIRIYDLPFFGDVRQEVGKITNFHLENLD